MTNSKKENNGCLQFFVLGLLSVFSFVIIYVTASFTTTFTMLLAISGSILFLKLVLGKTTFSSLIKSGVLLYLLFYGFIYLLNSAFPTSPTFTKEEESKKTTITKNNETLVLYTSKRKWVDNYGNNFSGELSVREKDYNRLKNQIENYNGKNNKYFWGRLYNYLEQKDTPSLDLVIDTFAKISREKKLNQMEFAEMVVSCIQDIPYAFVLQATCPTSENYDKTQKVILENCPECCIGNIKYGIQNPVSFIKNLKGDCDTRTVLIYSILKHFNYDVSIVNSDFYRHSIIGLNIPSAGKYKAYKGKKYMLWETTVKNYKIGELPPNFSNIAYWNIVLISK